MRVFFFKANITSMNVLVVKRIITVKICLFKEKKIYACY